MATVPVKPFGVAKERLAPVLSDRDRSRLGKAVAHHTVSTLQAAGASVAVVTGDARVAAWARRIGADVVDETRGRTGIGLDRAADAAARAATALGATWMIVHADLPLLRVADVRLLLACGGAAIAPSHDGGTAALVGEGSAFPFSYGPGSFHRHLAAMPGAAVVTSPGLALDLDSPHDLERAAAEPAGAWIRALLPASLVT